MTGETKPTGESPGEKPGPKVHAWTFWVPALIVAIVYMTIRQRFLGLLGMLICFITAFIAQLLLEWIFYRRNGPPGN